MDRCCPPQRSARSVPAGTARHSRPCFCFRQIRQNATHLRLPRAIDLTNLLFVGLLPKRIFENHLNVGN